MYLAIYGHIWCIRGHICPYTSMICGPHIAIYETWSYMVVYGFSMIIHAKMWSICYMAVIKWRYNNMFHIWSRPDARIFCFFRRCARHLPTVPPHPVARIDEKIRPTMAICSQCMAKHGKKHFFPYIRPIYSSYTDYVGLLLVIAW